MKKITSEVAGRKLSFYFTAPEKDIKNQIGEIFLYEHYKTPNMKNAVVVDLGANVGIATTYFAEKAKKVYAIEPCKEIYDVLVANTKHLKNVECFNFAAGVESGEKKMFGYEDGDPPQTFFPDREAKIEEMVQCKTLEDFLKENKIKHVDILKVDIEGAEYLIFPHPTFKSVAKKVDIIVGESHYLSGGFPALVGVFLNDYGFKTKIKKLKKANLYRNAVYTDPTTGKQRKYEIPSQTVFISTK